MTDLQIPLHEMMKKANDIMMYVEQGKTAEEGAQLVLGRYGEFSTVDDAVGIPQKIDRCLAVFDMLKLTLDHVSDLETEYKRKKIAAVNALDGFKNYIKFTMDANPEQSFEGTKKRRFALQKNSADSLTLNFKTSSMSGLVTKEQIEEFKIPKDCYKKEVVFKLDKEALKEKIRGKSKGGEIIKDGNLVIGSAEYGSLEQGQHLRVR